MILGFFNVPLGEFYLIALIALIVGGFLALGAGGKYLTQGAVGISKNLSIDPLIVGLTVVSVATSMPEFSTTLTAAEEFPGLAMGNILGSNIANTGLILGVAALLMSLKVKLRLIKREVPFLVFITILFGVLVRTDGVLSRFEGVLLLATTVGYLFYIILIARSERAMITETLSSELEDGSVELSSGKACVLILSGAVLLMLGAELLVQSSVEVATRLGVSEVFIGLTVLALGTSLPELAASIAAVRAGQGDLCVGNIIGSNIFNLLLIGGGAAAYTSLPITPGLLDFEFIALLLITFFFSALIYTGRTITRTEGGLLLLMYFVFIALAFLKQLGIIF